jgi:hypothetical protein
MKVYREWQHRGDRAWLEKSTRWPNARMDFCIEQWDPAHGAAGGAASQHLRHRVLGPGRDDLQLLPGRAGGHGALARELEGPERLPPYEELAQKGAQAIEGLFNGEYYEQQVTWEGLRDTSLAEKMAQIGPGAPPKTGC